MVTLIVFECVDVSVTIAAASMLLRFVVARPTIGWSRAVAGETDSTSIETTPTLDDLILEADATEAAQDGISLPERAWSRLVAA